MHILYQKFWIMNLMAKDNRGLIFYIVYYNFSGKCHLSDPIAHGAILAVRLMAYILKNAY